MGLKDQLQMLKHNWLFWVLLVVVALLLFSFLASFGVMSTQKLAGSYDNRGMEYAMTDAAYAGGMTYPVPSGDFAPEVEDRKITKTTSLNTEVDPGAFDQADSQLRSIITSTDSYLLNANTHSNKVGSKEYKTGSYTIKVDTAKYDAVINQLKQVGTVKSFTESATDITGSYTNLEIEIQTAQARLQRYETLYASSTKIEDKITLNDRIFDQERTIKYLQDRLANMDSRVDYSTVSVTIYEKQSDYASVAFLKFADLIKTFIGSVKGLLYFLFAIVPWAIFIGLILWVVSWLKKRKD